MSHYFVIVAAGSGSRFGGNLPKQFCDMGGRPLLMTTIDNARRSLPEASIVLVLSPAMIEHWKEMCARASFNIDDITIVAGGDSRTQSVANALSVIPDRARWISIHDGARPILTPQLMKRIEDARGGEVDGIIPAIAVTDSLRAITPDGDSRAVDRSTYRAVQTPQSFPADKLKEAYRKALSDTKATFTDDASVMEAAGFHRLKLVEGDYRNIKVTRPGDIEIASIYADI